MAKKSKKRIPKIKKSRNVVAVHTEQKWDDELLSDLGKRNTPRTPDFLELKLQENIPVFVYGTLKKGNRLHEVLSDCPCLGRGITSLTKYDMKNAPSGSYPVAFEVPDGPNVFRSKIQGEIYIVDARRMLDLDQIENNGSMYTRKSQFIKMIDQTYSTTTGPKSPQMRCWIYLGNMDYWEHFMMHRPNYRQQMSSKGSHEFIFDWEEPKMLRTAH
jgi:gamma-glutamylcyclotransferase (GGCT)/AIG2-like uncharacterized protein YtfP